MKKFLTILFLMIVCFVQAQKSLSEPAKGFVFPLGSKFVLKLVPIDSVNYECSVMSFEPFEEIVDTWGNNELFSEEGEENTILFYFCLGTSGETEQERKNNMKVLLLMKNFSKEKDRLFYTSEIQLKKNGKFQPTSNVGTYPNVKTVEMWSYMIYSIGLKEFRKTMAVTQTKSKQKKT